MERHMTVPSRALVIVSTIVVLALALLLVLANGASAGSGDEAANVVTVDYRVRAGDTLWLIADEHAAADQDIRSVVEQIRRLNGLESGVIQAGQVLVVPQGT